MHVKNNQEVILNFLIEEILKQNDVKSKNVLESTLYNFIINENISVNKDVRNLLEVKLPSLNLKVEHYNKDKFPTTFERDIEEIFKNENLQDSSILCLYRDDVENEIKKLQNKWVNLKFSDDLISKLINTKKSRLKNDPSKMSSEAIIATELLRVLFDKSLELFYLNVENVKFDSLEETIIIEQRLNHAFLLENPTFLDTNHISTFRTSKRSIISDLLDYLPTLSEFKLGVCLNYPEDYIKVNLEFVLTYFEKSELDYAIKQRALNIIEVFYDNFIFNQKIKLPLFEECKEVIKKLKNNVNKSLIDENRLNAKSKKDAVLVVENIFETNPVSSVNVNNQNANNSSSKKKKKKNNSNKQ